MKENDQDQRVQELLLLQRVSNKINSILNLDTLLEEIVGDVAETFGYTRSGVLLKDNETNELEIAAVRGWTINYHMKGERLIEQLSNLSASIQSIVEDVQSFVKGAEQSDDVTVVIVEADK